ncbi:unnamed protein product [Notodromas monacha]|uniref:CRAL-TRIO domain-containing protein n=1 Tax=Notodromas monacha TaxID=399045 RepID=A0A7R9GE86_9CRUS|nr:unnamed protein product [Notodromas monacha]CAG0917618.1 unnamed protein product [Notodromas monacha]
MSPHPPHDDHEIPLSPSAPELREFDEDYGEDSDDDSDDYFHDAADTHYNEDDEEESTSSPSLSTTASEASMSDLLMDAYGDDTCARLSPELAALAAQELGEDPNKRAAMIKELRHWAKHHAAFSHCRLDATFMLRFLRMKKFNMEGAKEAMTKYFKFRHGHPYWAADLDIENPTLHELTSKGFVFVLPERDDQGRRVIFNIAQKLDPSRHTSVDMAKMFIMCIETLLEDEENQIRGIVYITDCRDLALQNIMIWTPADIQKILTRGEKAYPMRHKMIHFMNLPLCAWFAYELLRSCLTHKLRSRIMTLVWQRIRNELQASWIEELKTHRKKVLSLDDMEYHSKDALDAHHEQKSGWGIRKYLNKAWMSAWHKAEKAVAVQS